MKTLSDRKILDRLLKRAAMACRKASALTRDIDDKARLCAFVELKENLGALKEQRTLIQARIAKTQHSRTVASAYGQAAALRFPHR
ncbi:MAG: hypothetical protein JXQ84_03890 [Rhodospirillaceae bacterium]|nr:hypothetical protein [Rhodospirillaceae bacterium]